jgi:prepilin-type N-terminal cleavage/methylation domain-containing protein
MLNDIDIRKATLKGFTLIEVAVVLIIVGFLLGGLITPLSAQLDSRHFHETQNDLAEIKEALIGYALSHTATDGHPYLPCPDTDGDGLENRVGSACQSQAGTIPSQNLGIAGMDSWNNLYIYSVTPQFANNAIGFTLSSTGNITVLNSSGGSNLVTAIPVLVLSKGKNGAVATTSADELENTNLDAIFVSHDFSPTFDDLVMWISSNLLFNRMVTAGKLP